MTRRTLILLAAAGSFALLGGAFLFQLAGYPPCKMCIWQRWPHGAAIALGLIGAAYPAAVVAWLGAAAAAVTSGLGFFHAGVEQGWWEGPTSCTGTGPGVTGLSGADLLSTEGAGAIIMCDEIVWSLFGLSMAAWNGILSAVLVGIWIAAARARA
ncbi:disulfide bond formation protein B [Tranquillimonas alkanivorans]|uniref:Disulfide bond formation protein DsbB n=1 Tax=Tranquillimonas alkanivorans TaxID=441119 RepID=A0A1I5RW31_9RHOB|nr:disulfide bond formation protein B [Tranquillimonas alkanivorans]SFP62451.1 Disulfide bond formation protein DsbB [Tranquillimonas alkanivorans]